VYKLLDRSIYLGMHKREREDDDERDGRPEWPLTRAHSVASDDDDVFAQDAEVMQELEHIVFSSQMFISAELCIESMVREGFKLGLDYESIPVNFGNSLVQYEADLRTRLSELRSVYSDPRLLDFLALFLLTKMRAVSTMEYVRRRRSYGHALEYVEQLEDVEACVRGDIDNCIRNGLGVSSRDVLSFESLLEEYERWEDSTGVSGMMSAYVDLIG